MYPITSPDFASFPRFQSFLNTLRMIKCSRPCQPHCRGAARVRFAWYLCCVVFIRARMGPICSVGSRPSPTSKQVFCTFFCVSVGAWLVLRGSCGLLWIRRAQISGAQADKCLYTHRYTHVSNRDACTHWRWCAWKLMHTLCFSSLKVC